MNRIDNLKESIENINAYEIKNNNNKNDNFEESEKEDPKEVKSSDSKSDSNANEKSDNENEENENEEEEEEEGENTEEENDEENNSKNIKSSKEKNSNSPIKANKRYEEDNIHIIPLNPNNIEKNNKYLEEYKNNSINNEQTDILKESKNLKIVKEIEEDLIKISENIEKMFLKLDTSLIQDEKYLIDSLVIEAKKEGLLEETFGEKEEDNKSEKEDFDLEERKSQKNEKISNNRINMSKIYEVNNNMNTNRNKFPYDYNKNREYYESLN